jgi:hypothetical protein
MTRSRVALLAIACLLLGACHSGQSAANAAAASDPCAAWLSEVKRLCTDFVEGREVSADCSRHAAGLGTMFAQPQMADPKVGPQLCSSQREPLQRELAATSLRPAVSYGEACQAFASQVKADCVDSLGNGDAEMMTCAAKFSMIGTARGAADEQRESACEMGAMLYRN